MGGNFSRGTIVDNAPSGSLSAANSYIGHESGMACNSQGLPSELHNMLTSTSIKGSMEKQLQEHFSFPQTNITAHRNNQIDIDDGIPCFSRVLSNKSQSTKSTKEAAAKVSEVVSLLGRAGSTGLGKAVEVLDTLGSSMTNSNLSSKFVLGVTSQGNKISILAFEVANTIIKGAVLMQSLSKENIGHLKEVVLYSEGVQNLVSKDMDELLRIAAADMREELEVLSGEVVRFGNLCKDHQWHSLDRYFEKLGTELTPQTQLTEEAEVVMQQLMSLVEHTAELYHELRALDRFEQDYCHRIQEEENSNADQRGDSLKILRAELRSQRKHVRSLKKKSLWSKNLDQVMEKLVDIVHFLHLEIQDSFNIADGDRKVEVSHNNQQRLGFAGLSFHYANIITQIETLVSQSIDVPQNTRDILYQRLPSSIKTALRHKLRSFQVKEQFTVSYIKVEMEKTLQWLVPVANNTIKAHHGFGSVGEWANMGYDMNKRLAGQTDLIRLQTLHHADKVKTEAYILELIVWLNHLVSVSRVGANDGIRSPITSPAYSFSSQLLTFEDQQMPRDVHKRKLSPVGSKSLQFDAVKTRLSNNRRQSKSDSYPLTRGSKEPSFPIMSPPSLSSFDFTINRIKALDIFDGIDDLKFIFGLKNGTEAMNGDSFVSI